MQKLKIVAVASSEETRANLYKQLKGLDFVSFDGIVLELSDAAVLCQHQSPDVILVDLTGRELDAGLFIQTISMNPENPSVIFVLHKELDHKIISEAVQQGAKEFIQYPNDQARLEAALRKHLTVINRGNQPVLQQARKGKLITVFSAKGGAGSTTVAVNLANELYALTGKPAVLFDMDQVFSNTAVMLNLKPSYALSDLSENNVDDVDEQLLKKIIVEHESGLHLVVGTKNVLDDNEMVSPELLEATVEYLIDHYAFVVVDLPSHVLDPYHQYLVEQSDEVVLVSCLDIPGLYRTRQYLDLVKQHIDLEKVKLVLNRWNLRAAYGISNQNLEQEFHYPVYCRLSNDWDLNVEANSLGCTLSKVNPTADLVKGFKKLASLVANFEVVQEDGGEKNAGFLGKLFHKKELREENS